MKKNIRRILITTIILSLLSFQFLCADEKKESQEAKKSENEANHKCFMWEVKSEKNTVYVLGTMHLMKKENYPLDSRIEQAFEKSDIAVFEAYDEDMDMFKQQQMVLKMGVFDEGDDASKHISKENYDYIEKKLDKYNLPLDQLKMYKVWLIAATVSVVEMMKLGYNPEDGIDKYFQKKAESANKEILQLESAEYQINLFNSFSDKEQEDFLVYTIKDLEYTKDFLKELDEYWKNGDIIKMEKMLTEVVKNSPELTSMFHKLVNERNINMTKKIEEYLKSDKTYFVAVGALHLVGEEGIVEILKKAGYQVNQL